VAADLPWGHVPAQLIGWNGRYVGLDFAGPDNTGDVVVASSTDLAKWTVLARGAGGPFPHGLSGGSVALVAGPAGLVAIGPFGVCVSPCTAEVWTWADGATWKPAGAAPFDGMLQSVGSVAGGPQGIVVLGSKGFHEPVMWHSDTGTTWNAVDLSAVFKDSNPDAVAAVPGGFVAIGGTGGSQLPAGVIGDVDSKAAAWWSQDGLRWSAASVAGAELATTLRGAIVTSSGLVAAGTYGGAWLSSDGHSWTPLPASDLRTLDQFELWSDGRHDVGLLIGDVNTGGGQGDQFWGSTDGGTMHQLKMTDYPAPFEFLRLFVTADGVVALAGDAGASETNGVFVVSAVATR
jgi:hypothetical protein